ncbi:CRISPR-associated endonuclease/helicase Cas3 [Kribbella antiqua]|uniref:CRISPR-associated endonuclease/helicase Cas3 n=1 Tax=Kribbella antiqua TaxID=2512217 RepID=A0A4R2I9F6_9ACTN|nr:CRISPR-associated helicase Cas3' [Kribbella antiqua]TCO41063.1 CRISPR-associated endonuclease/helicase Cas3 [Kribbella antiqua]
MRHQSALSDAARSVWAKSLDEQGGWLPLWQHLDDSTDVARRLFAEWLAPSVAQLFAAEFGGDATAACAAVSFLAGVHDLGKATPAFAVQDTVLAKRMCDLGLYVPLTKSELPDRQLAHHSLAGHHLLVEWLVGRGWSRGVARTWGVVLGGHHGVPPDAMAEQRGRPGEVPQLFGSGAWEMVREELVQRIAIRSGAVTFLETWRDRALSQQFQVLATGVVIMSDWIASNADLFPYCSEQLPAPDGTAPRAAEALTRLRLPAPWRSPPVRLSAAELFRERFELPPGAQPRPVQEVAIDVAREMAEPGIVIIEAPMGEGKTEAALAAAEALAAQTGAGGLFVALPTQATTDAMFARIVDWLDRMDSASSPAGSSITLSHGKARFNHLFRGLMIEGRLREVGCDESSREVPHVVAAHSWLSGRKKAQLANFTVGTIDQLLFAALKSRHLMLRHLGLAGKVVIIDEIHAYDAYMSSYLAKVLTWLGAYRVPVVALSATLPADRRRALVTAYQTGMARAVPASVQIDASPVDGSVGYPVVTWTDGGRVRARVAAASGRRTTVRIDALDDDPGSLLAVLRDALAEGGTALVVRNTVRRVLDAAEVIEREFPGEVTVAHSRFITADRLRNDDALLDRFGAPGRALQRPHRHVVVASQVVEQSLDVDFDLLVTDLAPIDLILQRMGRLHRHQRGTDQRDRPERVRAARALITGADFNQSPPALEPGARRYVYGAHALLRSAAVLVPHFGGTIELPDDIAPLVQTAYGDQPLGPVDWQDAMQQAESDWLADTARREERARDFQIADPAKPGRAIVGWLSANVGEADESSEGRGQVRDGAPSLEAILVQVGADGRLHTPSWLGAPVLDLAVPSDKTPPDEVAEVLASCAIRLPLEFSNAETEKELWESTPPAWEHSPLIYRWPALFVDDAGWAVINGRRVRYTTGRGLEVMEREQ